MNRSAQILRSSVGMTMLSLLGTIFGFLTQTVLAARFGAEQEMDAYLVSLTIPALVIAVFSGVLNYTFIPVFVEKEKAGKEREAWMCAQNLFNMAALVTGLLCVA